MLLSLCTSPGSVSECIASSVQVEAQLCQHTNAVGQQQMYLPLAHVSSCKAAHTLFRLESRSRQLSQVSVAAGVRPMVVGYRLCEVQVQAV